MGAQKTSPMLAAIPPWLLAAEGDIGTKEILNGKVNPFVTLCFTYTSYKAKTDQPWCAAFVSMRLRVAKMKDTNSAAADSYRTYGSPVKPGQELPGDVLVFRWVTGDEHVTFLHHVQDASNYGCLGGNQSNMVQISNYPKKYCIAIRRPVALGSAPAVAPQASAQPLPSALPQTGFFDDALNYVFADEGGFTNDAADHGGATKYGITISDLSKWRKVKCTPADVAAMSAGEARSIYRAWYWDINSLSQITSKGVAIALFDIGVVDGTHIPVGFAQTICNEHGAHLAVDDDMGPASLAAVNAQNPTTFIREFSSDVEARFRAIVAANSSQAVFLKGWVNRAHRLLTLI